MATTILGNAIEVLQSLGFFDVVLPFLLVFTVVFGILEKTKIFGTDNIGGHEYPKKGLNSMVAFVIGFLVLTAKEIVAAIQTSLPLVSLILIAIVSFLMLVGSFLAGKEEFDFMKSFGEARIPIAMLFAASIILIFFHSFGWLQPIYDYISGRGHDMFIISIFVGVVGAVVYFVFDAGKGEAK